MPQIKTIHKGDMLFETAIGKHSLAIDVPASMGGSERGPTPPELFVASLGSCVGAFVANYCREAGIDASGLNVDVAYEKAEDPTRLTDVHVQVNIPHGDYKGREKAILRVAERCPVHETVCTLDEVETSLNGQSG
jgi:uncharacterized OsmC-like protein